MNPTLIPILLRGGVLTGLVLAVTGAVLGGAAVAGLIRTAPRIPPAPRPAHVVRTSTSDARYRAGPPAAWRHRRAERHPTGVTTAPTAFAAPAPGPPGASRHLPLKATAVVVGLLLAPAAAVAAAGTTQPYLTASMVASPACAVLLFVLVDRTLRRTTGRARAHARHAVGVYLHLVAGQITVGGDPVQALRRAADLPAGAVFTRLQYTLHMAGPAPQSLRRALGHLGTELGASQLGDLAGTVTSADIDREHVLATLRHQARQLHTAPPTFAVRHPGTAYHGPATLLALVLAGILAYPALTPLVTG